MAIIVITLLFYDAVLAKRSMDAVLGNLQSRSCGCYQRLNSKGKIEFVRRARAVIPLRMYMGEFTEPTLDVAATIWDEVFNQLLFLLSLKSG